MIDTSLDREYEQADRQQAVADGRRAFRLQNFQNDGRGRLTAAEAAERRQESAGTVAETAAVEEVPAAPVAPADSGAALRHARLGFVTVATLVLLLVWIIQRRKGG